MADHTYRLHVEWTGNTGQGTATYRSYERAHRIAIEGKPDLLGSSDVSFRGDASRHNPEELLVASLSGCHLLWYLHECSATGAVVVSYRDDPVGTMATDRDGGRFSEVVLRPTVTVADESMIPAATEAHARAHAQCFIARSVNFPVRHEPTVMARRVEARG